MILKPTQWMLIGFSGIVVYLVVTSAKKAAGGTTAPAATTNPNTYVSYTPPATTAPSASTSPLAAALASDQAQTQADTTLADLGNQAANAGAGSVTSGWMAAGWPGSPS